MDKRIIFKNKDGSIGIIVPTDCGLTVEEIANAVHYFINTEYTSGHSMKINGGLD